MEPVDVVQESTKKVMALAGIVQLTVQNALVIPANAFHVIKEIIILEALVKANARQIVKRALESIIMNVFPVKQTGFFIDPMNALIVANFLLLRILLIQIIRRVALPVMEVISMVMDLVQEIAILHFSYHIKT